MAFIQWEMLFDGPPISDATRMTQDDLNKLLEYDPDEFDGFKDNADADPAPALEEEDANVAMGVQNQTQSGSAKSSSISGRKKNQAQDETASPRSSDVAQGEDATGEKQLEKELPWSMIPEHKKEDFRNAERSQWEEHLKFRSASRTAENSGQQEGQGAELQICVQGQVLEPSSAGPGGGVET